MILVESSSFERVGPPCRLENASANTIIPPSFADTSPASLYSEPVNNKLKKALSTSIKVLIAVGLIYWLSTSGKFDWEMLSGVLVSPYSFVLLGLVGLNLLLNSYRWHLLLHSFSVKQSFYESFKLGLVGIFFNYAMPGGVGGDLVKGYYIVKSNPDKRTASATSILLDRLVGIASMAVMALVAILLSGDLLQKDWRLQSIGLSLSALVSGLVVFVFLSRSKRIFSYIEKNSFLNKLNVKGVPLKVLSAFKEVSHQPSLLFKTLVLSVLSQTCLIFVVYLASVLILQVPIDLKTVYFAVPLGMIVSAAPIAPAGIGVGQVALYSFFSMMGAQDPNIGSTGITVIQLMLFAWGLFGSYYYIRMSSEISLEKQGA